MSTFCIFDGLEPQEQTKIRPEGIEQQKNYGEIRRFIRRELELQRQWSEYKNR